MIEAFLLLRFAQWWSTTKAQPSVQPPSCYYSVNQTLDSVFYPCGDPMNGFKSCCEGGDNCLANNACYSPDHGTTYLAGCTDPDYSDSSCPNKPNLEDHSWVGLVTCNHVSTNWFACGDNAPTVTHGMGCSCPQTSATLAFTAANSPIQNILQLGAEYPQSSCFPGFTAYCSTDTQASSPSTTTSTAVPSSTVTSTYVASQTTSTSLTTNPSGVVNTVIITQLVTAPTMTPTNILPLSSSSTTATGGFSPTDLSTPSEAGGLETPVKIGIGVGSAVGAVCLGALLWYCISCMRKRHKKKSGEDPSRPQSQNEANGSAENEKLGEDDPRSPTWSGHKSELPADDLRSPTRSAHKSELPADDHEMRSPVPAYEPYRGSYRSSRQAEADGSPRLGGEGRADRGAIYEMP